MTDFAPLERIDGCLQNAAGPIAATDWQGLGEDHFASAAAEVFGWLNWAHPFRDGNGRASRAFLDAVARKSGRWLDYSVSPRTFGSSAPRSWCPI
jgi:cell filamentation protein